MRIKTFTLIELILVVAIVAILAAAMMPMITSVRQNARIAKVLQDIEAAKTACMLYYADTGRFGKMTSLSNHPNDNGLLMDDGAPGWNGPYIDRRLIADDNPFGLIVMVTGLYPRVFDLDGDNVADKPALTAGNVFAIAIKSQEVAQKIDQKFDNGIPGPWWLKGRVIYVLNPWLGQWFVYIALYDPNL